MGCDDDDVASDSAMDNEVGSLLRRLRGEQTQASLANVAKVGQKTISEIETGRRIPSPIVISKLEAALKAPGQLELAVKRATDDRAGWEAVLAHLEAVQARLGALEANTTLLLAQFDAGEHIAVELRDWVIALAGYGEQLSEHERAVVIGLARQLADPHMLGSVASH